MHDANRHKYRDSPHAADVEAVPVFMPIRQSLSAKFAYRLAASLLHTWREGSVSFSSALLYRRHNLETAVVAYLPQSPNDTPCLVHDDIAGPQSRRGARQDNSLPFMQRDGDAITVLVHHAVDDTVEKHLQCPWHIPPVAWRSYDHSVSRAYHAEHTLGVILRHDTFVLRPAFHARYAGPYIEAVHIYDIYLGTVLPCLVGHGAYHA